MNCFCTTTKTCHQLNRREVRQWPPYQNESFKSLRDYSTETLDPLPLHLAYCAARIDALRTIPGLAHASQEAIQKASTILLETQRRLNELSGLAGNITSVEGALGRIRVDLTNLRKELRDKINESLILLGGDPVTDAPVA